VFDFRLQTEFHRQLCLLNSYRGRFLAGALGALLVLVWQTWDGLATPQLWAEDCLVFMAGAHEQGWKAQLVPYAGYWHVAPRLIAQLADMVPLLHAPLTMALGDLLVRSLALGVMVALLGPRILTFLLFSAVLLTPQTGEMLGNVTSAQWYLAFALIGLLLVEDEPQSQPGKVFLLLSLVVAALSTPLTVALAPLFLAVLWLRRGLNAEDQRLSPFIRGLMLLMILSALLQLLTAGLSYEYNGSAVGKIPPWDVAVLILERIVDPWDVYLSRQVFFLVPLIAALVSLSCIVRRVPATPAVGFYLGGAFCLVVGIIYVKMLSNPAAISVPVGGDRYFWIPRILLVVLLLLPVCAILQRTPLRCALCVLVCLVALHLGNRLPFSKPEVQDLDWPSRSRDIVAQWHEYNFAVTRVPPGWLCVLKEPDWIPVEN
jgi:hypothetical protein